MNSTVMFTLIWAGLLGNFALLMRIVSRLRFVLDPLRYQPAGALLTTGDPAPSFVAETLGGELIGSSDYAEGSATLIFISHHCPACRSFLPSLAGRDLKTRERGR